MYFYLRKLVKSQAGDYTGSRRRKIYEMDDCIGYSRIGILLSKNCWKHIRRKGADRLLLLGDILYHGPRNDLPRDYAPKEVIALLNERKNDIYCVRGNCDTGGGSDGAGISGAE